MPSRPLKLPPPTLREAMDFILDFCVVGLRGSSAGSAPLLSVHRLAPALHGAEQEAASMGTRMDSKATMQPKAKDDSVRMSAKALITTTEPARAHAVDLVLLGHLLASRLKGDGSVDPEWEFARVWRDSVVPVAAANMSDDWKVGM